MAQLLEAARMSLVPEEIRTVEDRIDYLSKSLDELRASSATKGIKSLERRIDYLQKRKGALTTMLDNYTAKNKKNPVNKPPPLHGDAPPTSCTGTDDIPSPPPPLLKKLRSEEEPEGQEQPAGAKNSSGPVAFTDTSELPPLPFRRPQFPHGGDDEDFHDWVEEVERVRKLNAPRDSLPTHLPSACKCLDDPVTADVVGKDKMMLLPVADVVVSISYPYFDPTFYHPAQDVMDYCSGMIISWDKPNKKARILTCDYFIGRRATKRKVRTKHYASCICQFPYLLVLTFMLTFHCIPNNASI